MDTVSPSAIDVHDIHKSFANVEVLKGVSMTAHKGDVISMLGSSGSGKSTFLRCLNLLEIPNAGSVAVNGETIAMDGAQALATGGNFYEMRNWTDDDWTRARDSIKAQNEKDRAQRG